MRKRTSSSRRVSEEEGTRLLFPDGCDVPSEIIAPLCSAVGGLVLGWGTVDSSLHLLTVSVFDKAGGKSLEAMFPRELSRKVKFLRRAFRKLGPLKPFEAEVLPILEKAVTLGTKRHGVIHAVLTGYEQDSGRVRFTSLDANIEGHLIKVARHTVPEIQEISLECTALGGRLVEFADRVHKAIVGQ